MISESLKQELISLVEEKVKELEANKSQIKVDRKKEVEKEPKVQQQNPASNYGVPGVC